MLSKHDREALSELERRILADDPRFAARLREGRQELPAGSPPRSVCSET